MGSALRLPVIVADRLEETAGRLASFDVEFWAAVAEPSADSFEQVSRPDRLALVLGDEDRGVEPDWLARCRRSITIPMRPGAGSLNVSVAAGILLYNLTKITRQPYYPGTKETHCRSGFPARALKVVTRLLGANKLMPSR
jgi:TrmH family RNA methyltransferase